jgi:uncharacterized protein (TIGR03435 family)
MSTRALCLALFLAVSALPAQQPAKSPAAPAGSAPNSQTSADAVPTQLTTPPVRPQFEVASVKPVAKSETQGAAAVLQEVMRNRRASGMIPMTASDRVHLENWTLLDLVAAAYSVRATQVFGPAWLSDRGFDIEAKVPDGTLKQELNAMLQSLLEDRFGLKVHRATKTGQGFALTVGKNGPKLQPSQPPPVPAQELTEEEQKAQASQKAQAVLAAMMKRMKESSAPRVGFNTESWGSITTEELAAQLVRFAQAPVIDETGLTGKYSVTIETSTNADVPGGTVFDAVEKLGLKLEPQKVTIYIVIVDQVSKNPTPN